jgi:hypothetical protein
VHTLAQIVLASFRKIFSTASPKGAKQQERNTG